VINNFTAGWLAGPPPRGAGVIPSFGGPIQGVLSGYVAVPAEWLTKAPVGLSDVEASTLPCAGPTSSDEQAERAKALGARHVINASSHALLVGNRSGCDS
jgi:NADPH:quinone reductase-like Zn-dependent oxidoreductase